ncbi:MAG: hypothetical protein ABII06_05935 [Pseudomonadota bacterium]
MEKIPKDVQDMIMEVVQDVEYIGTMRNELIVKKEARIREKAGMKTIKLPPEEAAKFVKICYDKTWEYVTETAPEYAPKLRKASSRAALPKGAFPWQ